MTRPAQPKTRQRLTEALARHGVTATVAMLDDLIEATKRESSAPKAIQILQTYGGRPEKVFWESLSAEIDNFELWENVVSGWAAKGYKMMNVADMLACYKRGDVPGAGQRQQLAPRSMGAVQDFMREQGLATGGLD